MLKSALRWLQHAVALDHDPKLSAQWVCPCKLCAAANPDQLTPGDYHAKVTSSGMCGQWISKGSYCMRRNGHRGRCLP